MKRYLAHALVVISLALAAVLASQWRGSHGEWRQLKWLPPAAIQPDFSAALPAGLAAQSTAEFTDPARFAAVLDRPLFSPNRRPAPAAAAVVAAVAPPPDPLGNVVLLGLYAGAGTGGIIATVDGATKRMAINETIGSWTLKSIVGREVHFVRGAETRVVPLLRVRPAASATAPVVSASAGAMTAPAAAQTAATGNVAIAQKMEDEARENLRRRNELRARAGLKPVPP